MGRKYDLVIFGATGFTGKFVVEEVAKFLAKNRNDKLTWAVAGRSQSKLSEILREGSEGTGQDLSSVPRISAEISDQKSLEAMASQTSIILNCVGPYRFYGENVIKACLTSGTHYVDISGEQQFLEKMQILYHAEAQKKKIYIVGAVGFDCIPSDCGVTFLQKNFDGDLNSVEVFAEFKGEVGGIHYGTWQSGIHALARLNELPELRKKLFPKSLPTPKYKVPERGPLHYSEAAKGWCVPMSTADSTMVERSQYHRFHEESKRPAQIKTLYGRFPNLAYATFALVGVWIFAFLVKFKVCRYLFETFPRLFTLGIVSHEGPSREAMNAINFKFTISGEGWKEKLSEPTDQHSEPPNKKMIVTVKGNNPGYGATCTMMLHAALTIIRETDKLPSGGGVFTPGTAFLNTTLVDRLNANGVKFTIESK